MHSIGSITTSRGTIPSDFKTQLFGCTFPNEIYPKNKGKPYTVFSSTVANNINVIPLGL